MRQTEPSYAAAGSEMFHALYLPSDWASTRQWPILVEYAGNGPFDDPYGDYSPGTPEGSNLGYGLTAGQGAIWISMPFGNLNGSANQGWWWGCPPNCGVCHCYGYFNATPTLDYTQRTIQYVAQQYSGNLSVVVLLGFSRGAIAVNYMGYSNDAIAATWKGSIAYAHYLGRPSDTVFPYPCNTSACGEVALARVAASRAPQYIVEELDNARNLTQVWVNSTGIQIDATYASTGFCNHNDAWVLRPSRGRDAMRAWYAQLLLAP